MKLSLVTTTEFEDTLDAVVVVEAAGVAANVLKKLIRLNVRKLLTLDADDSLAD
ncbi:hypothetical protein [Staphylococcus capitis]